MNVTIGIVILCLFLIGLIWLAISRATEDGFFTSLWTVIVLFSAYQFARLEWDFFVGFLTNQGMSGVQAISTGYWTGFLIIVAPGMLAIKFLSRPKVPFPYPLESYGSTVLGACAGVLLFATVIQWLIHFEMLRDSILGPVRIFGPLFHILGYRSDGFE